MACSSWRRWRAAALVAGVLAGVAACGGGGSGGGSDAPVAGKPAPAPGPAGQIAGVTWLQPKILAERDVFATTVQPTVTASLSMQAPAVPYWFSYRHDPSLSNVAYTFRSADEGIDFSISFVVYPERAPGSYTDTLSVTVCYDEACTRPVPGSPFKLPLRLDVGYLAQAEGGVPPWAPAQTQVLNHDVVDAAYSAALDSVVTIATQPAPALRVHDLRSGMVRVLALATAPTALSLSADGLQAAVGHDAAVSLVDLREAAASPIKRMDVPMPVGSVVLAGSRVVAIGAQANGWNGIYWVDTVTGVASKAGAAQIYGVGDAVLHPAGDRVYVADRGLSPDDVSRMDLGDDPAAAQIHDTRYHGDYPFCSRLAVSPDGQRLYTGCGVALRTASLLADDMVYAGQMALSPRDPVSSGDYIATALSVSPDNASVALLEENRYTCNPRIERLSECYTRVAVYDAGTLARRSLHGLAPHVRGNDRLQQWGRHAMQRGDGSLLIVAEVRTKGEAIPTWLLHRSSP